MTQDLPYTPVPQLVVGAAIVDDLDRPTTLLSARRTDPPELAGGWELPGGKVEAGEEPLDALLREIREELGGTSRSAPSWRAHWPVHGRSATATSC